MTAGWMSWRVDELAGGEVVGWRSAATNGQVGV